MSNECIPTDSLCPIYRQNLALWPTNRKSDHSIKHECPTGIIVQDFCPKMKG